jgi:intracellular multiplication protein IcmG
MKTTHFDLNTPPVDLLPEEDEVTEVPIASKPSGPKLITLPLGIKVTLLQAGLMIIGIIGLIIFGVLRNAPQDTIAPPQFASQDSVSPPTIAAPVVQQPSTSSFSPATPTTTNNSAERDQSDSVSQAELTSATMQAIESVQVYGENNREGLTAIDQRLRALEKQVNDMVQRQAVPPPSITTATLPASKKSTSKTHQSFSSLHGASITSLYPGLAWVSYQGSTWAVRPGDRIGTATVSRIDTEKREVITTTGVIR